MCVLFPQLSQPAVSIDGQVSNPPSTSSTEVNSQQTVPEQQQPPLQEVKMDIKTDEGEPEQTELQMEEKSEVRLSAICWVEYLYLVLLDAFCLHASHSFQSSMRPVGATCCCYLDCCLPLLLPKERSLFSGEMVVEASGHRKDHDNVIAAVRLFAKCKCKRALRSVLQMLLAAVKC